MIMQLRLGALEVAWEGHDLLKPGTWEITFVGTVDEHGSERDAKALLDHVLARPPGTPWRDGANGIECARGSLLMLILLCSRLHRLYRLPLAITHTSM